MWRHSQLCHGQEKMLNKSLKIKNPTEELTHSHRVWACAAAAVLMAVVLPPSALFFSLPLLGANILMGTRLNNNDNNNSERFRGSHCSLLQSVAAPFGQTLLTQRIFTSMTHNALVKHSHMEQWYSNWQTPETQECYNGMNVWKDYWEISGKMW